MKITSLPHLKLAYSISGLARAMEIAAREPMRRESRLC